LDSGESVRQRIVASAWVMGHRGIPVIPGSTGHARPAVTQILVMRIHPAARDSGIVDPTPARYAIRIHGHLGVTVLSAFPALVPQWHDADTVLTGLLDRSALYGVLAEIEALGLDLVEIRQLTQHRKSPKLGHTRST